MASNGYDQFDQISLWISEFKGQRYMHMQQKPFKDENKRSRYIFLPIETVPRLIEKVDSVLIDGKCSDEPICIRTDYQVLLSQSRQSIWELKVMHVSEKMKPLSQIDIVDIIAFSRALKQCMLK